MPQLEQLLKKYPESVKVVFKNFPLGSHKFAYKAAVAALAAGRQGKFWAFHDELFANSRQLSDRKLDEIAEKLDLDKTQFEKDQKDPTIVSRVQEDYQEGISLGVRGIPAVFVNGKRIDNRDLNRLETVVRVQLSKTIK